MRNLEKIILATIIVAVVQLLQYFLNLGWVCAEVSVEVYTQLLYKITQLPWVKMILVSD